MTLCGRVIMRSTEERLTNDGALGEWWTVNWLELKSARTKLCHRFPSRERGRVQHLSHVCLSLSFISFGLSWTWFASWWAVKLQGMWQKRGVQEGESVWLFVLRQSQWRAGPRLPSCVSTTDYFQLRFFLSVFSGSLFFPSGISCLCFSHCCLHLLKAKCILFAVRPAFPWLNCTNSVLNRQASQKCPTSVMQSL